MCDVARAPLTAAACLYAAPTPLAAIYLPAASEISESRQQTR